VKLWEFLKDNEVVVLTGAGISADSGIPTFRGKDGLWNKYKPEELATPEAFRRNPKLVWEWYMWRMEKVFNAKPNKAHLAIAKLEEKGIVKAVITQNVDNLHERAGSKNVIHLHGRIDEARCEVCGRVIRFEKPIKEIPFCCTMMRPNVVWFGEALPEDALRKSIELVEKYDVLVVGTSGVVQPAASLPIIAKKVGNRVAEVNVEESALTPIADIFVKGRASEVFGEVLRIIEQIS